MQTLNRLSRIIGCLACLSQSCHSKLQIDREAFRQYLQKPSAAMVGYAPRNRPGGANREETIDADLAALRAKFNGLVIYDATAEADRILSAAHRHGYVAAMLLVHDPRSEEQLRAVAALVVKFRRSLALAVCIGSEGLLDHRYAVEDIEAGREKLDSILDPEPVEMTTAEPWWLYLNEQPHSAPLRAFGDFISLHIHPVWDADISDGAAAADWSFGCALRIAELSKRQVVVRETGFPGAGTSPRAGLRGFTFSRVGQAAFWKRWQAIRRQQKQPFPSLAIAFEGIDNPLKQTNDFEAAWGLLSNPGLVPYPAWNAF
jgi:exo-beta-1,3-glucanase (GH17 family)